MGGAGGWHRTPGEAKAGSPLSLARTFALRPHDIPEPERHNNREDQSSSTSSTDAEV